MHGTKRLVQALVLFMVVALSGCSTVRDLFDDPSIYGGVDKSLNDPILGHRDMEPGLLIIAIPFNVIDLALSAIGDTALLPFTVPYDLLHDDTDK